MKNAQRALKKKSTEQKPKCFLIVHVPFRNFKRGDRISDSAEIDAILASHAKTMVTKVLTH